MTTSNFYLRILKRFLENLLYLIGALFLGFAFVATICGDGNKGFLDFF